MTIERHDGHPPGTACRPAGNGLCEPLLAGEKPRGTCPACGREWPLRKDGRVQAHHGYPDSKRLPGGNCLGSGAMPASEVAR